jgi:quercetin dioxygenase-like cupin family protein
MRPLVCAIILLLSLSGNGWAREPGGVTVQVLTKSTLSWDGSQLPHYPRGMPEITILKITIPPGVELPLHQHPVINAGVLLKGQLTVVSEDHKTMRLKAGNPIVEVVGKWHYGKNDGNQPAEIVVFYAGKKGRPITIER